MTWPSCRKADGTSPVFAECAAPCRALQSSRIPFGVFRTADIKRLVEPCPRSSADLKRLRRAVSSVIRNLERLRSAVSSVIRHLKPLRRAVSSVIPRPQAIALSRDPGYPPPRLGAAAGCGERMGRGSRRRSGCRSPNRRRLRRSSRSAGALLGRTRERRRFGADAGRPPRPGLRRRTLDSAWRRLCDRRGPSTNWAEARAVPTGGPPESCYRGRRSHLPARRRRS